MNKYLEKLFRVINVNQVTQRVVNDKDESYRSLAQDDLTKFVEDVTVTNNQKQINYENIAGMLEPITKDLSDKKVDNAKLIAIAPEIEQAASILIPSILSPNDFRKNNFTISIDSENEPSAVTAEVIELLQDHFGNKLGISTKLSEWMKNAIFKIGSKVLLVLPTQVIPNLRDMSTSLEALSELNESVSATEQLSLDIDQINDIKKGDRLLDSVGDIEDIDTILSDTILKNASKDKHPSLIRKFVLSGVDKSIANFNEMNLLSFTDDPLSIVQSDIDNVVAMESLDKKMLEKLDKNSSIVRQGYVNSDSTLKEVRYKNLRYLDISQNIDTNNSTYPSLIELPSESVIPITVEGSPSNHIGYFVVLNSNGVPVSVDVDNQDDFTKTNSGSSRVDNMYQSFYGSSYSSVQRRMTSRTKSGILNSVYDAYLDKLLDDKLEGLGLDKFKVNLTNDLSRVMFSRLLKNTKTKILFVPKSLVTFLAYDYHPNGTGRSKIDQIKFPLSLKMTLIITRLISLIESSINRRKLNITLDDTVGNPIEVMRTIKKEVMKNKTYGISYDPSTIVKSSIDKQLTVVPNKITGVEDFSIEEDSNTVDYPRPDDSLLEEIDKMYTLSLGVTPSAMNRLGEDEFSRSVASNNIFFSNQLRTYQGITTEAISSMMVSYISFSSKLQDNIKAILENSGDTKGKLTIEDRMNDLLHNIKMTLPSPNISQDKAAFEELKEFIDILDNVLEKLYSEDMVHDRDLQDTVKAFRSFVRKELLNNHLKTDSIFGDIDFDALTNPDIVGMFENDQTFANIKKAMGEIKDKFNKEEGDSGSSSSGGGW